ncbi:ATP-dependent RNA helicase DDX51/DBP6 [Strigomonas culicis]|uniref:ATP-dependent RNA helicase DDX51/DBP6 n=1 Tax=Strigomonas culicis TaxID=28005 RepID=S9V163_9TRYP|nr:ATP-dependent RNA helicase DDX51/DBP6 [Strigomonas culicis]|eukprot:EPY20596.1 ATP-dependent RNA helicase DDX51/DBP6 [Strigomonas culicis]
MEATVLRGLVLVPTRALGQQVYREAVRLTARTNIRVVQLCDEGGGTAAHTGVRAEGAQLVREVAASSGGGRKRYYSLADLIIATPQKLLRHLDYTEGFTLRDLKLCVVDEADELLAVGNFANLISKIIRRQEEEVRLYYDAMENQYVEVEEEEEEEARQAGASLLPAELAAPREYPILQKIMCSATLTSRITQTSEMDLHNCQYYVLDSNGDLVDANATLHGAAPRVKEQGGKKPKAAVAGPSFALPPKLQEHVLLVETKYKPAALLKLVFELTRKISAAVWARQQRGREERERLKLKQFETEDTDSTAAEKEEAKGASGGDPGDQQYPTAQDVAAAGPSIVIFAGSAEDARIVGHFLSNSGFPNIIEFTILTELAERQKALLGSGGKYNARYRGDQAPPPADLSAIADLKSYLDDTIYYFPLLLVATDALVRGIDIPQVGHVINYEAPRTLQSYIHRAGRTARALRRGHVHTLLNAKRAHPSQGSSHEAAREETEYERYQAKINPFIARTLPLRYERSFFKFEKETLPVAPRSGGAQEKETTPADEGGPVEGEKEEGDTDDKTDEVTPPAVVDFKKKPFTVKWFIKEANAYMSASVLSLSDFWGSALQHKKADQKAHAPPSPPPADAAAKSPDSLTKKPQQQKPHAAAKKRNREERPHNPTSSKAKKTD